MSISGILKTSMLYESIEDKLSNSAWIEHVPFSSVLVELLKPSLIVELGVHMGTSYFSFCNAVKNLGLNAKCFGVDTWIGDVHAGYYDSKVYKQVIEMNEQFKMFSVLKRTKFDDAVDDFKSSSIDLLHIDGLHTYEAVRNDFYMWLPKMSRKGVVVFHDISVVEDGFGVYKLWFELLERFQGFKFEHGNGLGVLFVGEDVPDDMVAFFEDFISSDSYSALFALLGRQLSKKLALRDEIVDLKKKYSRYTLGGLLTRIARRIKSSY